MSEGIERSPAFAGIALRLPVPVDAPAHPQNVAETLALSLWQAGVTHGFGLIGGAIAPFARALHESPIELVHCRHESGAVFGALEGYFASGRPGLVFTTTGPGLTNALTGIAAARWEGGKVVLVSAATAPANRGRWAFQETGRVAASTCGGVTAGALFDYAELLDDPAALPTVTSRLARGLARPGPFLAHLQVPVSVQAAPCPAPIRLLPKTMAPRTCTRDTVELVARTLAGSSFALWVGFGARDAAERVRRFAEHTGAPVMCTPRGKGVFPESHPLYLGVTGFGGHAAVDSYMSMHRPDYLLVLGSRLGEMTSLWDRNMLPDKALVHVDLDPAAFGAAFPDFPSLDVESDVGELLHGLLALPTPKLGSRAARVDGWPFPRAPAALDRAPVRPSVLMDAIQRVIVDRSNAIVMSEAGNAFAWATHWLRFSGRSSYRVSMGFGSMGHAVTGVVGAALTTGRKAVALVGDGTMLMNNEVSTAVQHDAPVVWIVLNDARYGMIHQGMESIGYVPFATEIPRSDFASVADALGAHGLRVTRETEVAAALEEAMAASGPVVVDVCIDPDEEAPSRKRNRSLLAQGVAGEDG